MTNDETINSYRACFITDPGRRVLGHLLIESGYFDKNLKTPEEIAVRNFGLKILKNAGMLTTPESVSGFVNKLFELEIEK